jgi:predicted homoserine dehydrogenase-like protein
MIIVDTALKRREAEGNPIRVGMIGAGAMGRAIAYQIEHCTPGMKVVAVANRSIDNARKAFTDCGIENVREVTTAEGMAAAMAEGAAAITTDPTLVCRSEGVDVVHEVTGSIEYAAHVILDAIAHGKMIVTMNAEVQGTIGPVLKARADAAGVLITDSDGDQPGVMMNLYRFVEGLGVKPVCLGNMKGLHDAYRNPTTQQDFSRKTGITPHMAASFADGTKMSFEMTLVANATGLRAGRRGLYGPDCKHVHEAVNHYPADQMKNMGVVDYIVGAEPAPGVFCIGHEEQPLQSHWLKLYKLGDGPFYTFYTPYHLCHLEAPTTVARAALFNDRTCAPDAGHVVDVIAMAKQDLNAGDTLDGIGWYMTYGVCENADVVKSEGLLPMGLAEGCRLKRDIPKDRALTYDDIELPADRLADALRAEQIA